ncbi:hypothetical protein WMY93_027267 [Mugilogobius chulae]|uniref:Uncharacterized protein n=1 Tax=Mugilogobius chulae TaxID=88201 RepID=A0AAW0MZ82_9GOBI
MRRNPGKTITIYDIPSLVANAHRLAASPRNIQAGFRVNGIYPFDRNVFSDMDFAQSQPEISFSFSGSLLRSSQCHFCSRRSQVPAPLLSVPSLQSQVPAPLLTVPSVRLPCLRIVLATKCLLRTFGLIPRQAQKSDTSGQRKKSCYFDIHTGKRSPRG